MNLPRSVEIFGFGPLSFLAAATRSSLRAETQREQEGRLRSQVDGRLVALPYLFVDHVGAEEVEELADALERQL